MEASPPPLALEESEVDPEAIEGAFAEVLAGDESESKDVTVALDEELDEILDRDF